ncbi:MAG: glycyl radical protein [Deltaproteobacteria bacterium]|nr:glycyl radical protein [Deltaproteobacteria bacterium]MBW2218759.1 glycyl radical protein [Deltaproteobacteria bacterium]
MLQTSEATTGKAFSPQEERIEHGEPIGLVGDLAKTKRARIQKMLEGFRDRPIRLNVDRALLLTESMKDTEGQPMVLRWAKALSHILNNFPIHIGDKEIIVGSAGPPGRYAIVYPELQSAFVTNIHELNPSEPDEQLVITKEDIDVLKTKVIPYWQENQYSDAMMRALPDDTRPLMEKLLIVTPTATARSMLAWAHDYEKVLKHGIKSIKKEAEKKVALLDPLDTKNYVEKKPFLDAVILVCNALIIFANRYASLARSMAKEETDIDRKKELLEIAEICERVPENPARTFHEAVQSQWFIQTVSRLEQCIGGAVSNGRIDQYLYPFYKKDIDEGRITEDDALMLLESLWLGMAKNTEVYFQPGKVSYTDGYAHWEATTIGGQTKDGKDATNELSYLILQSKREFPLNYPDLSARVHSRTPDAFLYAICKTIKEGTGFPKVFFDEEIIPSLLAKGGDVGEANDYCIVGCTETKMLNREAVATGCAWVNLGAILEMAMYDGKLKAYNNEKIGISTGNPGKFISFDDVWNAFCLQAENIMKHTFIQQYVADTLKSQFIASPMFSMLHDLCLKDCKDIHSGPIKDAIYLGFFDIMGFGTLIDSLAAIKKLVFDDKKLTMDELIEAMDANFEGKEAIRQMCLNAPKYGNNDPYADSIGHDIEEFFARLAHNHKTAFGGELDVRYVSITSHVPLGMVVGATPDGRNAFEPLSESISPSQGVDTKGPTATLTSIANTKCTEYKERAARLLNMKLTPAAVAGEEGTKKLMSLIRTICDMKMWHIQFNIINKETLIAAQKDPEKYKNLLIRVAGYSAYFVDLTPGLQNEIIKRTAHNF